MLRYIRRALWETEPEALIQLAAEYSEYRIRCARESETVEAKSSPSSLTCLVMELTSALVMLSDIRPRRLRIIDATVLTFTLPLTLALQRGAVLQDTPRMQIRTILNFVVSNMPVSPYFDRVFLSVPGGDLAKVLVLSAAEVVITDVSHGVTSVDPWRFLKKMGYVAATLAAGRAVSTAVKEQPVWLRVLVMGAFANVAAPMLQKIMRYGLSGTWNWVWNGVAVRAVDAFYAENVDEHEDEDEDDPPEALLCAICRDTMRSPVELQGKFFCDGCLSGWMQTSSLHPMTGTPISGEMIEKSFVMSHITRKYRNITRATTTT